MYELADNTIDRNIASESYVQYTQRSNSAPLLNADVKLRHLLSRLESQSQESGLTRRLVVCVPEALELLARGAWHKRTGASSSVCTRAAHADAERFWRLLAIRSTHTSLYFLQLFSFAAGSRDLLSAPGGVALVMINGLACEQWLLELESHECLSKSSCSARYVL